MSAWHREIDFQPPEAKADVGRMTFISPNLAHEDDPEEGPAGYHEVWERIPGTSDPNQCWEYRLEASDGSGTRSPNCLHFKVVY